MRIWKYRQLETRSKTEGFFPLHSNHSIMQMNIYTTWISQFYFLDLEMFSPADQSREHFDRRRKASSFIVNHVGVELMSQYLKSRHVSWYLEFQIPSPHTHNAVHVLSLQVFPNAIKNMYITIKSDTIDQITGLKSLIDYNGPLIDCNRWLENLGTFKKLTLSEHENRVHQPFNNHNDFGCYSNFLDKHFVQGTRVWLISDGKYTYM